MLACRNRYVRSIRLVVLTMADRSLKPHEQKLLEPHRAGFNRAMADHPKLVEDLAERQGLHTRTVYRLGEGTSRGAVWVPRLVGELAGPNAFAAVSGADALGYVVVAPPAPGEVSARDLVVQAIQLGGDAVTIQRLLVQATSPDSPGGRRIVASESAPVREGITQARRALALLEQMLDAHERGPALVEVSRR